MPQSGCQSESSDPHPPNFTNVAAFVANGPSLSYLLYKHMFSKMLCVCVSALCLNGVWVFGNTFLCLLFCLAFDYDLVQGPCSDLSVFNFSGCFVWALVRLDTFGSSKVFQLGHAMRDLKTIPTLTNTGM